MKKYVFQITCLVTLLCSAVLAQDQDVKQMSVEELFNRAVNCEYEKVKDYSTQFPFGPAGFQHREHEKIRDESKLERPCYFTEYTRYRDEIISRKEQAVQYLEKMAKSEKFKESYFAFAMLERINYPENIKSKEDCFSEMWQRMQKSCAGIRKSLVHAGEFQNPKNRIAYYLENPRIYFSDVKGKPFVLSFPGMPAPEVPELKAEDIELNYTKDDVPYFVEMAYKGLWQERTFAASWLSSFKDPNMMPLYLDIIKYDPKGFVCLVVNCNMDFPEAIPYHRENLRTNKLTASSLRLLGELKDRESADLFMKYADCAVNSIREMAIFALGQIGDKRALGAIKDCLLDPKTRSVHRQCVVAMANIDPDFLGEMLLSSPQEVRDTIILGMLIELPHDKLEKMQSYLLQTVSDENDYVRGLSLEILGDLKNQEILPLIIKHSSSDPSVLVRKCCAETLANYDQDEAFDALVRALDDEERQVRVEAERALKQMAGERHTPKLKELIQTADKEKRGCIDSIISEIHRKAKQKRRDEKGGNGALGPF